MNAPLAKRTPFDATVVAVLGDEPGLTRSQAMERARRKAPGEFQEYRKEYLDW